VNRLALPDPLSKSRLVAVLRGLSTERALDVAAAASLGGVSVFEVTMESPTAEATITALTSAGHVVGAGTVLSPADVRAAANAGARFLVAPNTDPVVVAAAGETACPMIPGAFTPTEVAAAWRLGVAAVKLFPASVGGPSLVRSIKGPLTSIPLMVTGGIQADNVAAFLLAGASMAGVGGWLVNCPDLSIITERAAQLVAAASA
jgi:2-dehydro-3-deoxyphosphogluconate aldolase/(4S)-4-hydroxy-2-oxoglutarate aldolase